MNLNDYTDPANPYTPRPKASQAVARAKRENASDDAPTPVKRDYTLLATAVGLLSLVGVLVLAFVQPAPRPLVLEQPTTVSAQKVAPTPAPTFAPEPTPIPAPVVLFIVAPDVPAQTGRGLTIDEAIPTPEPSPAPSYIENVGAQAEHSPRGDGQPGPNGGDWALVPTAEPAYLVVVGAQQPHKVR